MAIPILIMFPFLFLSILKETWYPYFFMMARIWAKCILIGMGFNTKIVFEQHPEKGRSYMFVANHTSMIDIMLMLSIVENPFVFVGKKNWLKFHYLDFFIKEPVF